MRELVAEGRALLLLAKKGDAKRKKDATDDSAGRPDIRALVAKLQKRYQKRWEREKSDEILPTGDAGLYPHRKGPKKSDHAIASPRPGFGAGSTVNMTPSTGGWISDR